LQLIRIKNADFISLQYKDPSEEIAEVKEKHGVTVHHFPWITEEKNYDLTAGLVAELDLIITVPTSVSQLAGGLGIETWVLVPPITGWLFYRDDYVWANSVKTYHNWEFKKVAKDLHQWLETRDDKAA
jgi:hypothetical protein